MRNNSSKNLFSTSSIQGWSMAPLIKPGHRLLINFKPKNYKLGDIVIFFKKDKVIAHRIIKTKKNKNLLFLLKGDNTSSLDGWFTSGEILGRVEKIIYPNYKIDLTKKKGKILNHLLVAYSQLNYRFPFFLNLRFSYKISFLKILYRKMVTS